jgi:hypothetical protein
MTVFGGTAQMFAHLSQTHSIVPNSKKNNTTDDVFLDGEEEMSDSSGRSQSKRSSQRNGSRRKSSSAKRRNSSSTKKHRAIHNILMTVIATAFLPLSFVMNASFRLFCRALNRRYEVPGVYAMSNSILNATVTRIETNIAKDIKGLIIKNFEQIICYLILIGFLFFILLQLKECACFCVTTDMWKARNGLGYNACTVHFVNSVWELKAHTIAIEFVPGCHTGFKS